LNFYGKSSYHANNAELMQNKERAKSSILRNNRILENERLNQLQEKQDKAEK